MTRRETEGGETWRRLRNWNRSQITSERLSAHILRMAGYTAVDPSHPLGGPDGLKDVICQRDGSKWIGAVYFSRDKQTISDISSKFEHDLAGVGANNADGIAFVTNQHLTVGEREQLTGKAKDISVDLFHLERIVSMLDWPACYGIRLEYLDIEMAREEQIAFTQVMLQTITDVRVDRELLLALVKSSTDLYDEYKRTREASVAVENSKEPQYVTPIRLGLTGVLGDNYTFNANRYHQCSHCSYGYIVKGALDLFAGTSFGRGFVTCPNCGNVDRI